MPAPELVCKLVASVEDWIHLSAELLLHRFGGSDQFGKTQTICHNHQIDIAAGAVLATGEGAEEKRASNPVAQRRKAGAQIVGHAKRLDDQAPEFLKDGAVGIRSIHDVHADVLAQDNPRRRQ